MHLSGMRPDSKIDLRFALGLKSSTMSDTLEYRLTILRAQRRATLVEIADVFGSQARALLPAAKAKLSSYDREEISEYIREIWPSTKAARQQGSRHYHCLLVAYPFVILVGLLVCGFGIMLGPGLGFILGPVALIGLAFYTVSLFRAQADLDKAKLRLKGLTQILLPNSDPSHVGILIEAFNLHSGNNYHLKARLATLLPLFFTADTAPLDPAQRQILLRERQRSPTPSELDQWAKTDEWGKIDAAFCVAILHYFEQEAVSHQTDRQDVSLILPGGIQALPEATEKKVGRIHQGEAR